MSTSNARPAPPEIVRARIALGEMINPQIATEFDQLLAELKYKLGPDVTLRRFVAFDACATPAYRRWKTARRPRERERAYVDFVACVGRLIAGVPPYGLSAPTPRRPRP